MSTVPFSFPAEKKGSALQGISEQKPNATTWSQPVGATCYPLRTENAS